MSVSPRSRWRVLRWLWLLIPLSLVLVLALSLQGEPLVAPPTSGLAVDAGHLSRAQLLIRRLDPRAQARGSRHAVRLSQSDLNVLLTQFSNPQRAAQFAIEPTQARLALSLQASMLPTRPWLNLQLEWAPPPEVSVLQSEWPRLRSARIGRLPLPPSWVEALAKHWLERQYGSAALEALNLVERWRFEQQALWLRWQWQPEQATAALAGLWTPAERAALISQHQAWQAWATQNLANPQPLMPVMQVLAKAALERVQRQNQDGATELRALLLQLTLRTLGRDLSPLLPEAAGPKQRRVLVLKGRDDMAQHFVLSAWLNWQGGDRLTRVLGLAKELADARGGSGFSFNDLAADAAGERFGRACAANPVAVLAALATGLDEAAVFPEVADLSEFLSEAEFRRRYGTVGSPAYQAEMARIQSRIAALPLYRGLPASSP
ncbi:hypothetical protein HNQ51_002576 [Inhella inkyongensis]|uniref:Uncharacterized protein n=1 Tax=Inhella inkyongensis TaxID=392593 RepID=A0A840S250_9BURK|nr:hypothetical protein [Inhella inkyongensis]MBB5205257.1 hypothetical protein [Inhella inkyongensis]